MGTEDGQGPPLKKTAPGVNRVPWHKYDRYIGQENDNALARRIRADGIPVHDNSVRKRRIKLGIPPFGELQSGMSRSGSGNGVWMRAAEALGITYAEYIYRRENGERWCNRCRVWHSLETMPGYDGIHPPSKTVCDYLQNQDDFT